MQVFYLLAALGIGALISTQPAINAGIAARLGGPMMAAVCSIAISLAIVVAAWGALGRFEAQWSKLATLPWWALLGGAAGAFFVIGGIMVAPKMGVAMFFICIVLGQLIGAAVADQLGAFGLAQQPVSWLRAAGIALVVAGAALTQAENWLGR